jgi:hypothetical protein
MPVQLPDCALLQMLLCSRNVVARREIIINLFAHPSTWINPCFRVAEAPFEVWHSARIGGLLSEVGWVGEVNCAVSSTCAFISTRSSVKGKQQVVTEYRRSLPLIVNRLPFRKLLALNNRSER